VDGITVHELLDWLRENNEALTASLLDRTYLSQPVRGAQIKQLWTAWFIRRFPRAWLTQDGVCVVHDEGTPHVRVPGRRGPLSRPCRLAVGGRVSLRPQ
jgi:hypothetical protein